MADPLFTPEAQLMLDKDDRPGMETFCETLHPATVADKATFEEPFQYPVGIDTVMVNGQIVLDEGKHTNARPGEVLRRQPVPTP